MENVVLIIHLLLAFSLIVVVLLQRSEGGGLGMGGGGGGAGGRVAGRSAGTAMGKLTWILAGAFICTSMTLTVIAAADSAGSSVLDRLTDAPARDEAPEEGGLTAPQVPEADGDAPILPSAD